MLCDDLDPMLKVLGRSVRDRRNALGLSQEELASRAGLHRTYVSDVERGIRNVTIGALWHIASGLELPIHEMLQLIEQNLLALPPV